MSLEVAEELGRLHWQYIYDTLKTHNAPWIDVARYHYVSAFVHGFKHGMEYVTNNELEARVEKLENPPEEERPCYIHSRRPIRQSELDPVPEGSVGCNHE